MQANLTNAPETVKATAEANVVNLDVRPILQSGGEPFSVIMQAVSKVPPEGALRLRATFEPKPLFRVLGGKGFQHWVEYSQGDDWMIWFYKESGTTLPKELDSAISEYPELPKRLKVSPSQWTLDVRDLPPPTPMEMTLAVLNHLPKEAKLLQINQRVPQFLLPLLEERKMEHSILKEEDNHVEIEIRYIQEN